MEKGSSIAEQIAQLVPATVYVDFQQVVEMLAKQGWELALSVRANEAIAKDFTTKVYYPYRSLATETKLVDHSGSVYLDENPMIVINGKVTIMWRRIIAEDWKSVQFVPHLSLCNLEVSQLILDLAGVTTMTFLLETETVRLPIPEWVELSGFGIVSERIPLTEAKQKVLQFVLALAKEGLLPDQLAMLMMEAK